MFIFKLSEHEYSTCSLIFVFTSVLLEGGGTHMSTDTHIHIHTRARECVCAQLKN